MKPNEKISYDLSLIFAKEKLRRFLASQDDLSPDVGLIELYDYFMEAYAEHENTLFDEGLEHRNK